MTTKTLPLAFLALAGLTIQAAPFQPGHLAVLRAGDGVLDLKLKQSPAFIDEFAPGVFNAAPVSTVAIPTNGPETLFFNGHAATEGMLARSEDRRELSVAGYGGVNLLQAPGTPSLLDIGRAFCTVDVNGGVHTRQYKLEEEDDKMNPRGVVTDGTNNFWGCGNAVATLFYNDTSSSPVVFDAIESTRAVRIINHVAYVSLNGPDGMVNNQPGGIFSFQDSGIATPLPQSATTGLHLVVPARAAYDKIAGFDMNPEGTVAYTADTEAGIQKYVKANGTWKFAYNFPIPQNISAEDNHASGCFGVVVDFHGPAPIIYATTTEGYNGCVNSNRVVQIVDTNANATVTTLAQAPSDQIAYRGIDFTPEADATGH